MMSRDPRLRILHLLNDVEDLGNGINNVTVDLACEQADAGHAVTVASAGGAWAWLLTEHGVDLVHLDQRRTLRRLLLAPLALVRVLRRVRPDVVHAHNATGTLLAAAVRGRHGAPLVATAHREGRNARLMRFADLMIVLSKAGRDALVKEGLPADRLRVVRNGTVGGARARTRQVLPPPGLERPSVVTVCGMYSRKGIPDLLRAFVLVRKEVPRARLRLVGDGPERDDFERLADQLGLSGAATFEGFQSRPDQWLSSADVFVLASHQEPASLVLAEAREAGCAIVATDVGGSPNMLDQGRAGLLTPAGDPERLASCIVRVLTDADLCESLRAAARAGLDDLTVARLARDVEAVYREATLRVVTSRRRAGQA